MALPIEARGRYRPPHIRSEIVSHLPPGAGICMQARNAAATT
jgi:hypothetical protein